jgi:type IV pilus assembly protein PilY1
MYKIPKASFTHVLFAAITTVMSLQSAHAGPGNLPQAPLFLSAIVEPNVFMTLDDSGSMDWELIVDEGTGGLTTYGGLPYIDGRQRAYFSPTFSRLYSSRYTLPPADGTDSDWDKGWIGRNSNGNKNYYDPTVAYEPWAGTDASGNPMYLDADPTAVLKDPNAPFGQKMDLTQFYTFKESGKKSDTMWVPTYFTWTDTNGNGVVDQSDAHTRVMIAPGTAEMKNFANWFQYYRSRINAAKAIFGRTINNTDASRMGLALLNGGRLKDVASMSDPALKRALLNSIYGLNIQQKGTPTRRSLEDVGQYFEQTGSGAPILSKDKGGECQQNFNLLMSDGFWNGNSPNVGNADVNGGSGNTIYDGDASQSNDGGNYADPYSDTLADVAMHFYENDLRPLLADKVPTQATIDEAAHQHLVTYTIAFGLKGTLDASVDDPLAVGFYWPKPSADDLTTVDDMWHAAYNSRGKFLSAGNPQALQASLSAAINDISQRTGTAAAVAINSAQLSTEAVVYVAQFNSNRWQGNLLAFPIVNIDTGELAATPKWDASALLTARDVSIKPRTLLTYDNSAAVKDGAPFEWASLSSDMKNDLKTNAIGGTDSDAVGMARLDYLRGDRSNEGTGLFLRERLTMLGDLVNSGPVFVGKPSLNWPDYAPFPVGPEAYSEFKNGSAATRKKIVYAGANDGMLHAFDDSSGEEVFAYVPSIFSSTAIGDGLHYLTEPNYVHKFYTDLTPTLSDVYLSTGGSTDWHTILIGGLRGGGRGLYALDVTNPALFTEANADKVVMWEFSSDDDADLGYTYSRPAIALTNAGTWVAIFGNGYNDLGSGEASLFIVDIEKGVDGTWAVGDYQKITTGVGNAGNRNGLASPALADIDGNGTVDRVYAGDLEGNVWAFDMESTNANQWAVAYKQGAIPKPLFTTQSNQPITSKPVLSKHPTQPDSSSPSNAPNIMVYVGSGQYLVNADKTSNTTQSFYGVWDMGDSELTTADLIQQSFDASYTEKVLTRNPLDYSTDHGWYFNLEDSGERAVTSPIARADTVFFNSFVPVDDPCSVGGYGYKYAVDMATGGSPLKPTFDYNNDGVIGATDMVSSGGNISTVAGVKQDGYLPEPVFIEDLAFTGEQPTKVKGLKNVPVGRFSWQELIQ